MLASTCSIRVGSWRGEVLVAGVHRLELAAVDSGHRMGEQIQLPAQRDELAARRPDRRAVVLPEVGDGLEVRRQAPGQPHQLDVALRLPLQPPARGDLVDVAVDVDLQQHRRVVGRPARRLRKRTIKPQRARSSRSTNTSITRTGLSSPT